MTEWSKAFRVVALTLLIVLFVVMALVFAMKSDFHFHTGATFNIKIEPTPQYIAPEIM